MNTRTRSIGSSPLGDGVRNSIQDARITFRHYRWPEAQAQSTLSAANHSVLLPWPVNLLDMLEYQGYLVHAWQYLNR